MSNTETKPLLSRKLVLDSKPESIRLIENLIDEVRGELSFKEDVYGNVMVAVTEAVNNSIFHGNKEDFTKKIFVELEMENQYRLKISVKDEGEGFDPSSLADPTAPENLENIGGRGVFLMEHLSDKLEFSEDGKEVSLYFDI